MDHRTQIGLIAQEVEEAVPEVVMGTVAHDGEAERLSVDYASLVPVLIEALKEQQRTIDQLSRRLDRLERQEH
jgi:hypothetical protein